MAAPSQAPPDADDRHRTRVLRIGALLLAIVLVAGLGGWRWWTERAQQIQLGDRGQVTATVSSDCMDLGIEIGDETYRATGGVPPGWRGRSIEGRLHLDGRDAVPNGGQGADGAESADGRFVGPDATVEVWGGRGVFFHAACAIWPE